MSRKNVENMQKDMFFENGSLQPLDFLQKHGIIRMLHKFNHMQNWVSVPKKGFLYPLFVIRLHSEFDKNANSQICKRVNPSLHKFV